MPVYTVPAICALACKDANSNAQKHSNRIVNFKAMLSSLPGAIYPTPEWPRKGDSEIIADLPVVEHLTTS
jgi:hypothetical protein